MSASRTESRGSKLPAGWPQRRTRSSLDSIICQPPGGLVFSRNRTQKQSRGPVGTRTWWGECWNVEQSPGPARGSPGTSPDLFPLEELLCMGREKGRIVMSYKLHARSTVLVFRDSTAIGVSGTTLKCLLIPENQNLSAFLGPDRSWLFRGLGWAKIDRKKSVQWR